MCQHLSVASSCSRSSSRPSSASPRARTARARPAAKASATASHSSIASLLMTCAVIVGRGLRQRARASATLPPPSEQSDSSGCR